MTIPEPYELVLLSLGAFRVWKLIGDDVILDRPRAWAVRRLGPKLDELLTCPWCAGFWISFVAAWGAWLVWPTESVFVSVPLAISAIVGFLGTIFHALAE